MGERSRHVVHIITGLSTGGAERALYSLLYGGLTEKFNNRVVSLSSEGTYGSRIRNLGIPVATLGMKYRLPFVNTLQQLRKEVQVSAPDVIQGWMYHGNLAATLAHIIAPGQPALAWNIRHSLYDMKCEKRMTRQIIRANRTFSGRPDAIIYNSHVSRQQHEEFGFRANDTCVIPNGFDLGRHKPSPDIRRKIRLSLGIPPGSRVIGHVARLHPMKNHAGFIRAAVRATSSLEDVHVILAGRGVRPDNYPLMARIPEAVHDRFHCLGEREDVPSLLNAMDVVVSSSSWGEAFPNILGEAMATGVPCVATNIGDSALIVDDTGISVPPGDEAALAEALMKILAVSETQRRELGATARARVRSSYSLATVVEEYANVYERLGQRNRTTGCAM